ncbi:MAG: SET domain-containing protein-lysine N-methyltransferase [Pseudomonadota bacterium]
MPFTVRKTPDKGLGVFAEAPVPKDSVIWRHLPHQFEVLDEQTLTDRLANLPREDAVYLLTHVVSMGEFPGFMINVLDEGALFNHADQPNVKRKCMASEYQGPIITSSLEVCDALLDSHFDLIAASNIAVGDELLMDYEDEPDDPGYYEAACERFGITWEWL